MQVATFLVGALQVGGTVIVIARAHHLAAIASRLDAPNTSGCVQLLDASDLLDEIVIGDRIDPERYAACVGDRVRAAITRGAPVRVYGEMVDLLWSVGNATAMLQLESLWHELLEREPFSLLCGYRVGAFDRDSSMFDRVLAAHDRAHPCSHVRGTESGHAVAQLEQRARALQAEIEKRRRIEHLMRSLLDVTSELAQATTREHVVRAMIDRGGAPLGTTAVTIWARARSTDELELIGASERASALLVNDHASFTIVPVSIDETHSGCICFAYPQPRELDEAERSYQTVLARHCALALSRVNLIELERARRDAAVRAAAAERAARALAEEATRAREEILSVVSHDLRNPLGTIMVGASTLNTLEASEQIRKTAGQIKRGAVTMARLIEGLVDFDGIQDGRVVLERRTHAPHDILSTTHEIYGPIVRERGLRLDTELHHNLPSVDCDSDRAVQVLSNLVANALKVTPKGGQIAIGASLMQHPDSVAPATGRDIVFFVRDTGPGIEPAELPNLFERTWRGKETSYRGAGLGLSIARGIVDAHGGRIWAESRPGCGSTFYFSLTPQN